MNHDTLQNNVFMDAHSRGVFIMLQNLVLKLKYKMVIVSTVKSPLLVKLQIIIDVCILKTRKRPVYKYNIKVCLPAYTVGHWTLDEPK